MSPADCSVEKLDDTGCSTTSFQSTQLSIPASASSTEMTTDDATLRLLPPPLPPRSQSPVIGEDAATSIRRKRFVLPPLVDSANRTECNTVPRMNIAPPDPVQIYTPMTKFTTEPRDNQGKARRARHSLGCVTADNFRGGTTHAVESTDDRRTGSPTLQAGSLRNTQHGARPVRYSVDSRNFRGKDSLSPCSEDCPPIPEPRGQVLVPPPLTVSSRNASPSRSATPRPDLHANERLQESSQYTELKNPEPSGPPMYPTRDPPSIHDPEDAASSDSLIASTDTLLDENKSFKSTNIHYYASELCAQRYQFNSARRDGVLSDNETEEHLRNASITGVTVVNANSRPYLMITLIIFLILFIILLFVFIGLLVTALI